MHRKLWEWCAIAQSLDERGLLRTGKQGIGFAVGQEPLASLFAARGADILATDLVELSEDSHWDQTGQHAASLEAVHWPGMISDPLYRERVRFQSVDMRDLTSLSRETYDFAWSSCALEHLGSLDAGLQFVRDAMTLLRPGGIAVHTTEFNVSSNEETVSTGDSVIYRRRDMEELDRSLRTLRCGIESLDFDPGTDPHDLAYDQPPYYQTGRQHLKLSLLGHICTSMLLIVRKG